MIEIQICELPEHVLSCTRYAEFIKLFPDATHFMIDETCFTQSLDPKDGILRILQFDFVNGLSQKNKVKLLVDTYNLYLESYEPFLIPEYDSWLGNQLMMLFKRDKKQVWSECAKHHYDELLDALEILFKTPKHCNLNSKLMVETIESNNINMFRRCIYSYGFYGDSCYINIIPIMQANRFEMFKIYVDYTLENMMPLRFLYISALPRFLITRKMVDYVYPHISKDILQIFLEHNPRLDVIEYLIDRAGLPKNRASVFMNVLDFNENNIIDVKHLLNLLKIDLQYLITNGHFINIFKIIVEKDNRKLLSMLFEAGARITQEMYEDYLTKICGKTYINITPAFVRAHIIDLHTHAKPVLQINPVIQDEDIYS